MPKVNRLCNGKNVSDVLYIFSIHDDDIDRFVSTFSLFRISLYFFLLLFFILNVHPLNAMSFYPISTKAHPMNGSNTQHSVAVWQPNNSNNQHQHHRQFISDIKAMILGMVNVLKCLSIKRFALSPPTDRCRPGG